jgi:hypothetical protein
VTAPLYSDAVYAIAECDEHGDLPHALARIRWIHTPTDFRTNAPCIGALHDYDGALGTTARILCEHLNVHRAYPDEVDPPRPLAIVHVTPDGCAPLVWITYDLPHDKLTAHLKSVPECPLPLTTCSEGLTP